ncbi:hypothetical protein VT50_0237625 [Streptomyces antioxidans]|uniref:Uncharacterized protein n=1 Tax=Streptomyces antioxidans TaxID=1507734 RepID=A0A1V4CR27_9ACTN|nr:hypothetical protein [Streptomyces antioxidans]OPF67858.1 hypothetical protein VT50_0237625 [Streptomyces antioxidans]
MDASGYRDLADRLKAYGLSIVVKGARLSVANPLSTNLVEEIASQGERNVTTWGNELGERGECGDENGTALRLALLRGASSGGAA